MTTTVSEHDYILVRKIEKYMEQNNIQQITSKQLETLGVRENPVIKELLKKKNGNPLTIQDIDSSLEKTEFYQHLGEYKDSNVQSHESLENITRHTYTLAVKNIEGLSENTKRFLDQEMKTHQIGFSNSDEYGFILYKYIYPDGPYLSGTYYDRQEDAEVEYSRSGAGGKEAVLIEEIQSDMARFIPKLFAAVKSENQQLAQTGAEEIERLQSEYGGEAGLKQISNELNKLTKNYVRVLLSAFLRRFRGQDVYISNAKFMVDVASLNPIVAKKIYDEIPRQFGFTDNKKVPWALKLENASVDYRHMIKTSGEIKNEKESL
jgi:hypothetical protein